MKENGVLLGLVGCDSEFELRLWTEERERDWMGVIGFANVAVRRKRGKTMGC